jgi:CAAX protease family protein
MSMNSEWPGGAAPPSPPLPAAAEASPHFSQENPPWSGWDVLRIGLLLFVLPFIVLPVVGVVVQKMFYRGTSISVVLQKPWLALSTQFVIYLLVLAYMIMFVEGSLGRQFWPAIRWVWPKRYWPALVALGAAMISLQSLERFFHLPQHIPMEDFLSTPLAAILTGIFAVSLGPLMEELFFRGFLYPVLARRSGTFMAIVITSVAFGLIHGAQLAFAWGLVLIIFIVGLVLTTVRAKTGSVAASFVVHVAYNSTLVIMAAIHGLK